MEHVNVGEAYTHNQKNQHEQYAENNMNNRRPRRSIRDLTSSNANYDPFHICPALDINFELKGHLLSNLPKFYGLAGENPFKHFKTMQWVCSSMKPVGAD